jgi:hypothetical protein
MQKVTSNFNCGSLFAQNLASQNSKGKYESRKILGFPRKMRKFDFFEIFEFLLLFILVSNYFEVFILFWNFEQFYLFGCFLIFLFLINNCIRH